VSIAQQTATPARPQRTRRHTSLELAPVPRRGLALAKIAGLVALTAFGAALAAGVTGLAIIMFVTSVGG
jgi:hypothetical protein